MRSNSLRLGAEALAWDCFDKVMMASGSFESFEKVDAAVGLDFYEISDEQPSGITPELQTAVNDTTVSENTSGLCCQC
jgi:hypothetical protein